MENLHSSQLKLPDDAIAVIANVMYRNIHFFYFNFISILVLQIFLERQKSLAVMVA